ncbi:MAG: DUF1292 domain-containing protein [Lachnospiraceae bacterium]|nr:DUF1292 domain-containing protein [Lachnospiraceae bacterium]
MEEIFPVDDRDTDICVTLELDDGKEVTAEIISIFTLGDHDYIVLMPSDGNGKFLEEMGLYYYRYHEDPEDGTPEVSNIESDEEFKAAQKEFFRIYEEVLSDNSSK